MKVRCVPAYGKIMLGHIGKKSACQDVDCHHKAQNRM